MNSFKQVESFKTLAPFSLIIQKPHINLVGIFHWRI